MVDLKALSRRLRVPIALAACAIILWGQSASAQTNPAQTSVEQFYRGRTASFLVPSVPGGVNDLMARLISRHLGRHVPGIGLNNVYEQNTVPQLPSIRAAMLAVATEEA